MSTQLPLPLSYVALILTVVTLVLTVLNVLALYTDLVGTIRNTPNEMPVALRALRQQIRAERAALRRHGELVDHPVHRPPRQHHHLQHGSETRRRQRRLAARDSDYCPGRGPDQWRHNSAPDTCDYFRNPRSSTAFRPLCTALDDVHRRFQALEEPFLLATLPTAATTTAAVEMEDTASGTFSFWRGRRRTAEKAGGVDEERGSAGRGRGRVSGIGPHDTHGSEREYGCGLAQRLLWAQSRGEADRMAAEVRRLRMEREVVGLGILMRRILDNSDAGVGGDGGG